MVRLMELVVDANVLISALIASQGKSCELVFNDRLRLYAPEFLLEEVEKYKEEILTKSKLSKSEFDLFLSIISTRIDFIPYSDFENYIPESEKFSPDPNDTEYFALALKLKCGFWSNDKRLKEQNKVKVYSTTELLKEGKDSPIR